MNNENMEVVKEKQDQNEQTLDKIEEKEKLIHQEIGFRKMIRFALLEQSLINHQAYLHKMVEADFAYNAGQAGAVRQAVIDKNMSNPKMKLSVPSISSLMKDCDRQRSLSLSLGKHSIGSQLKVLNDYKKTLPESSKGYYEEYTSLIGAFAHKILQMDDPKKVLLLLQMYNEGVFDSVFKEIDSSISKVGEELVSESQQPKTEPNEKVENN